MRHQIGMVAEIVVEGRLGGDALRLAIDLDRALVLPARQPGQPLADRAVAPHEVALLHALQLADRVDPIARQSFGEGFPDAPDRRDRAVLKEGQRLGPADHGEAARLLKVGGDLGEELAIGQADRNADAQLRLHPLGEAGERAGGGIAVQPLGAL